MFVFAAWIALRRVQRRLEKPSLDESIVIVAAGARPAASIAASAQARATGSFMQRMRAIAVLPGRTCGNEHRRARAPHTGAVH